MSDDKINDLNEYKKKKEDAKMQEAAINKVANLLQEEADQDSAFFWYWKDAVKKAGTQYFVINGSIDNCHTKSQLIPNIKLIYESLSDISRSEAVFLGLLLSFYDPTEGQRALEKRGISNFVDAIRVLDASAHKIIANLMMNDRGW